MLQVLLTFIASFVVGVIYVSIEQQVGSGIILAFMFFCLIVLYQQVIGKGASETTHVFSFVAFLAGFYSGVALI